MMSRRWRRPRLSPVVLLTTCTILCLSAFLTQAAGEETTEKKEATSPGPEGAGPPPVLSTSSSAAVAVGDGDDYDYDYARNLALAVESASGGNAGGASPKQRGATSTPPPPPHHQQHHLHQHQHHHDQHHPDQHEHHQHHHQHHLDMVNAGLEPEEIALVADATTAAREEAAAATTVREGQRSSQAAGKQAQSTESDAASDKKSDGDPATTKESSWPSSQPTVDVSSGGNDLRWHEATYAALFQPAMEEYDLLKFDPYSLSGAPLGGWGRATRSRLASLPLRLVSDFGGGVDLWYNNDEQDGHHEPGSGESSSEGWEEEEDAEPSKEVAKEATDASTNSVPSSDDKTASSSKIPKNLRPSNGPHFSIRDATGQRYICRFYAEDELVVSSRLDSVFRPAVTVWDALEGGEEFRKEDEDFNNSFEEDLTLEEKKEGAEKVFMFVDENGDQMGSLSEGVQSSVAQTLREMGMVDAADALERQTVLPGNNNNLFGVDGDVEVEVEVQVLDMTATDMEGNVVLGDDELNAMMEEAGAADGADARAGGGGDLGEIFKAGLLGAKLMKKNADDGAGNHDRPSAAAINPTMPAQLTLDEIYAVLSKIAGLCSQIHMGWWSYEWCHLKEVRQFHVAVSGDDSKTAKFEIQDVTSLGKQRSIDGKLSSEAQIIYPKGVYGGVAKVGRTHSINYDAKSGDFTVHKETTHTSEQDEEFEDFSLHMMASSNLSNQQKIGKEQMKRKLTLGHGGPIVRQKFFNGDYCEEVHAHREVLVEMRCCTEKEIDDWTRTKKNAGGSSSKLAVFVGVDEDSTCSYKARICTPLLCPKPLVGRTQSPDENAKSTAIKTSTSTADQNAKSKKSPTHALFSALFGEGFMEVNDGPVSISLDQGDINPRVFQELIKHVQNGGDFANHPSFEQLKAALKKSHVGEWSDTNKSKVIEVKEGMSLRELLANTLGKRPCLVKKDGWWTYEFCYGKHFRQYHAGNNAAKQKIESEHLLGMFKDSGNSLEDYPPEDEHLHVINATSESSSAADTDILNRKGSSRARNRGISDSTPKNKKQPGGNGAVYVQEYNHGDICDLEDVAGSVIRGGDVVIGSVERSSTVRFSCGKHPELVDIKEDSTCHYILDVNVPELCQHELFKAAETKTQVVKCLPA